MKIYAIIGDVLQTKVYDDVDYTPSENEVLMEGERPSFEHKAGADGKWYAPTLKEKKEQKYDEIKADRWAEEVGGCQWKREADGQTYELDTTDRSCLKTSNAYQIAVKRREEGLPAKPEQWKTKTGWIMATEADYYSMGVAISAHVQKCFDKEAEITAQIDKATTQEELDAIVWKSAEEPTEPTEAPTEPTTD